MRRFLPVAALIVLVALVAWSLSTRAAAIDELARLPGVVSVESSGPARNAKPRRHAAGRTAPSSLRRPDPRRCVARDHASACHPLPLNFQATFIARRVCWPASMVGASRAAADPGPPMRRLLRGRGAFVWFSD
jgi:hypothetical protein